MGVCAGLCSVWHSGGAGDYCEPDAVGQIDDGRVHDLGFHMERDLVYGGTRRCIWLRRLARGYLWGGCAHVLRNLHCQPGWTDVPAGARNICATSGSDLTHRGRILGFSYESYQWPTLGQKLITALGQPQLELPASGHWRPPAVIDTTDS